MPTNQPSDPAPPDAITQLTTFLAAGADGDTAARERAWRAAQAELRRIAKALLRRESHCENLQTTVLVQEAYLRLVGNSRAVRWDNRRHFFSSAGKAMRRFLVEESRRRGTRKRGGGWRAGTFKDIAGVLGNPDAALDLDGALAKLEIQEVRKAQIVELLFFCELTIDETAEVLGCSPRQIDVEWRFIRVLLRQWLS